MAAENRKTRKNLVKFRAKVPETLDKSPGKCYNVMYFGDDCIATGVSGMHTASLANTFDAVYKHLYFKEGGKVCQPLTSL